MSVNSTRYNSTRRDRLAFHAHKLAQLLASEWAVPAAWSRSWHATYYWPDDYLVRATLAQQKTNGEGPSPFQVGIVGRVDRTVTFGELRSGLSVDLEAACIFLGLEDVEPESIEWAITL
jgi:hypothetical protein